MANFNRTHSKSSQNLVEVNLIFVERKDEHIALEIVFIVSHSILIFHWKAKRS